MKFITQIVDYFDIFRRPTMAQIVEQELKQQTELLSNAQAVILAHKFQEHMAEANIDALIQWHTMNLKSNRTNEEPLPWAPK